MAKSLFTSEQLGIFESFLFIASGFSFFWITGLMQVLLSANLANTNRKRFNFANVGSLLIVISIVSVFFIPVYTNIVETGLSHLHILLLIIYMIINPISFLTEHILLLKAKFKHLILYGIATLVIPSIIILLLVKLNGSLNACFIGILFWAGLKCFFVIKLIIKQSNNNVINIKQVTQLLKESWPLIVTSFLAGAAAYIDGYIVGLKYDSETFAIFRYGAKEFPLFLLVASAFSNSILPILVDNAKKEDALSTIYQSSLKMIYRFYPMAILLLLSSHYIFPVVFNSHFIDSYKVFDIYILLIISRFLFPQSILLGEQRKKILLFVSLAELFVNIATSLIFIQHFGYLGVAYGTLIAYFFEKSLLVYFLKLKLKIPLRRYFPLKQWIIGTSILLLVFLLKSSIF